MKRYLAIIFAAIFLLSSVESFAWLPVVGQPVVYRGTITGLRISAVDGTAFIDVANASVTALADGNHSVEIYDSAGRFIRGVLKAAGAGETLGSANTAINNTAVSDDQTEADAVLATYGTPVTYDSVTTGTPNVGTYHISVASNKATDGALRYMGELPLQLLKLSYDIKRVSGSIQVRTANAATDTTYGSKTYSSGTTYISDSVYGICPSGINYTIIFHTLDGAAEFYFDNVSLKQVLTPSTSGAVIQASKGGGAENFNYKNASFTYNAASYYVIVKKLR